MEIESTHEVCGNLVAVETELERVADEKSCHDHSHCQSDCHLPSLQMKNCNNHYNENNNYYHYYQMRKTATIILIVRVMAISLR